LNQPQYQPYPQGHGHYQPVYAPPPPPPRNGLGLAAAIVGPIGILFGLVPFTGFIAVICGAVALGLGASGYSRYRRHQATNGKTAGFGLIAAVLALALGVWGIVIVFQATDKLVDTLNGPSPVGSAPAVSGAQPAASGGDSTTTRLGQPVTFDDGTKITVATPVGFTPSRSAAGDTNGRAIKIDVIIANGSDKPIDSIGVTITAVHGGQAASRIIDSAKNIGITQGTILPGKSMTIPVAFSIGKDPAELQVEVRPGFIGDPAIFTGNV
jgi:hypothetical protein